MMILTVKDRATRRPSEVQGPASPSLDQRRALRLGQYSYPDTESKG